MKSRVLPILNLIGCLVLTGLIVVQWQNECALDCSVVKLKSEVTASYQQAIAEAKRSASLESDIGVLKESIEATQQSAEQVTRSLAEKNTQSQELQLEVTNVRDQLKAWQDAIVVRDARLRNLNADVIATRRKLAEAIAKLKTLGAQNHAP